MMRFLASITSWNGWNIEVAEKKLGPGRIDSKFRGKEWSKVPHQNNNKTKTRESLKYRTLEVWFYSTVFLLVFPERRKIESLKTREFFLFCDYTGDYNWYRPLVTTQFQPVNSAKENEESKRSAAKREVDKF